MKCNFKSVLTGTPKLITAITLSALLVACGGGTSGDETDATAGDSGGLLEGDTSGLDGDTDGLGLTGGDTDGLGILDPSIIDEDNDGIPDQANYVDDTPCRGRGGSDPGSTNQAWNDNCTLEYDLDRDIDPVIQSPFYFTTYSQGVQRIVYCQEYAGVADSVDAFADGFYGINTRNAVIEFQKANGLVGDGIVGPITWAKLQEQVEQPALETADSDAAHRAYGIARNPAPTGDINCSADTNFFGRFSEDISSEDAFEAWEMSKSSGSAEKGSFSIAAPSN